ncbi:hypothetical protein [Bradyrhizobium paxllaeri]|uniref:hypothetical protein n=1 Tax=Bradyrhizobium paxllaeri TaxID=190148 RepID=UPI0011479070|nr:hypothetical protein [Bradyrhizobium paxllaeri]
MDFGQSAALRRIGAEPEGRLNVNHHCRTLEGWEFSDARELEAVMPKKAGVSSSALQKSDTGQFVSIALFSGIGLLISLVIVLCRMHGIF